MDWHKLASKFIHHSKPVLPAQWRLPIRYFALRHSSSVEPELVHLFALCRNFRCAVDVGTNHGYYAYKMAQRFEQVFAFEANKAHDFDICHFKNKNLHFFNFGLSNVAETRTLNIPVQRGVPYVGWASLADRNLPFADNYTSLEVDLQRLDDQFFVKKNHVDLIKIDVEGHELEVLEGGHETILRYKPVLIIEDNVGQREAISDLLQNLGYRGTTFSELAGKNLPSPNLIYLPA